MTFLWGELNVAAQNLFTKIHTFLQLPVVIGSTTVRPNYNFITQLSNQQKLISATNINTISALTFPSSGCSIFHSPNYPLLELSLATHKKWNSKKKSLVLTFTIPLQFSQYSWIFRPLPTLIITFQKLHWQWFLLIPPVNRASKCFPLK
jgi:hypothetical protein